MAKKKRKKRFHKHTIRISENEMKSSKKGMVMVASKHRGDETVAIIIKVI